MGQRIAPSARPSAATAAATPCTITATINAGTLWTSNNYAEIQCGVFWNVSVPPLEPWYNGLYWSGLVGSTATTRSYNRFDTCCSGSANRQNGPLLIDFDSPVQSVTIRTWDGNGQFAGPVGLQVRALNLQGDTIFRATTDGITPPTFGTGGIVTIASGGGSLASASTTAAATDSAIARVVVFPVKTGVTLANGDTEVRHATYQIEFTPTPPPDPCDYEINGKITPDPITSDPNVKNGFRDLWAKSNGDASALTDRKEFGGWIVRNADGTYSVVPWNIEMPFCGADLIVSSIPANVVGWVHTHPYSFAEWVPNCEGVLLQYYGTPSGDDEKTSDFFASKIGRQGLPSYILDRHAVGRQYQGSNTTHRSKGRCGY